MGAAVCYGLRSRYFRKMPRFWIITDPGASILFDESGFLPAVSE